MSSIKHALRLVEAGHAIFSCTQNSKVPITKHGYKDASNDIDIVKQWWASSPTANVGLPTGATSKITVLDIDVKDGADGLNSLARLEEEIGQLDTYKVTTPSGGFHYYFQHPQQPVRNRVNVLSGIDIRGDGGYVIAAGSVINGNSYSVVDPKASINPLPNELRALFVGNAANAESIVGSFSPIRTPATGVMMGVNKGARNHELFRLASSMVGRGIPFSEAKEVILSSADRCNPPLSHAESSTVLHSAYSRYQPNTNPTDSGNADRLLNRFKGDLRYVVEFGKWLFWTEGGWQFDDDHSIYNKAEHAIKHIVSEAQGLGDEETRRKLINHSLKSESQRSILAMEFLARFKTGIPVKQYDLDKNPMLLGLNNGVVDLRSGLLRDDLAKEELITKKACVDYDQSAQCPTWLAFLEQTTGGNQDYIKYIQRAVGYSLTGDTNEQVLFFLYGIGANGKSTFVNTIQKLLGDYSQQSSSATFMAKKSGSINNDIGRLRGSRMVATTETEEGSRFDESQN